MSAARPLGVTQRRMLSGRGEARDCLAADWYPFLGALGRPWLPLPNAAGLALEMAEGFSLGGLLLTGGDDLGVFPERDAAEFALLDWAERSSLPVIGVCRGFQVICRRLGGELAEVDPGIHLARRHDVSLIGGAKREVNSYHRYAPARPPSALRTLGVCPLDGGLEAASGDGVLGVMWHPERESGIAAEDVELFTRFLEK